MHASIHACARAHAGSVRGRHALLLADAEASLAQVLAGSGALREADVQDLTRQIVANLVRLGSFIN
jgi:hypothetical protein